MVCVDGSGLMQRWFLGWVKLGVRLAGASGAQGRGGDAGRLGGGGMLRMLRVKSK